MSLTFQELCILRDLVKIAAHEYNNDKELLDLEQKLNTMRGKAYLDKESR